MKSLQTLVALTAALSLPLLAACGVDSSETQRVVMGHPTSQGSVAELNIIDDFPMPMPMPMPPIEIPPQTPAPVCGGSISCVGNNGSVSVLCSANGNQCGASCPSGTSPAQPSGQCVWSTPATTGSTAE